MPFGYLLSLTKTTIMLRHQMNSASYEWYILECLQSFEKQKNPLKGKDRNKTYDRVLYVQRRFWTTETYGENEIFLKG